MGSLFLAGQGRGAIRLVVQNCSLVWQHSGILDAPARAENDLKVMTRVARIVPLRPAGEVHV
jgi:hypothetical protein